MRDMFYSRWLLLTLAIVIFTLNGCLGKSQSPRFYALNPMSENEAKVKNDTPARDAIIGIGPIKLADYLDQSKLVTRTDDNRMVKAEFDLWAGSFKDNLTNVLAENIGFLVPTEHIYIYPWRQSVPVDYQIVLDVVRFDGELGKDAWLVARWSLLSGENKALLTVNRSSIQEPVTGSGYAAMVAAQSRALAKISREIVDALHGASQGQSPGK